MTSLTMRLLGGVGDTGHACSYAEGCTTCCRLAASMRPTACLGGVEGAISEENKIGAGGL